MKMLVFYRSKKYLNAIVSSTKAKDYSYEIVYSTKEKLATNENVKGLDVDFVDLDKCNYIKVLSQMDELPQYIYIWFDEEKITDYIHENYPSIEVIHFNKDNSMKIDLNYWKGCVTKDYKLADLMIEKFKENLGKRIVYQVDSEYKITKKSMDDSEIANLSLVFNTRNEAKQYCIDSLKDNITRLEEQIEDAETLIKSYKLSLRKKNTLLKKLEQE